MLEEQDLVQSGSGANTLTGATTFNNITLINSSAEDGGHTVAIPLTNHATYLETGGVGRDIYTGYWNRGSIEGYSDAGRWWW